MLRATDPGPEQPPAHRDAGRDHHPVVGSLGAWVRTGAGGSSIRPTSRPSSAASARCRRLARVADSFSTVRRGSAGSRRRCGVPADRDRRGRGPAGGCPGRSGLGEPRRIVLRGLWGTELSVRLGDQGIELSLREWVNSGLMTFFFCMVGLEARREFDSASVSGGAMLPAAIGGMAAAVAIYLAFNLGDSTARGWGSAMPTDTALALDCWGWPAGACRTACGVRPHAGGGRRPAGAGGDRDRVHRGPGAGRPGVGRSGSSPRCSGFGRSASAGSCSIFVLGAAAWVALLASGVDPVVVGLAMGLLVWAYPRWPVGLRTRRRALPCVPRAAHPELERSARGPHRGDLAKRAAPAPVPPGRAM